MDIKQKMKITNQNLVSAFNQFVVINDEGSKKSLAVFKAVLCQVIKEMGKISNYFKQYGSTNVIYAGSVYDGTKVSKLNEFDMNIVIDLPISYEHGPNGIIIENDEPGFVKMKIMDAFDNLDKQPNWEKCHVVTREWRDTDKYFLQNKFRNWMHGLVHKALTKMGGKATVDGVTYWVSYKESGPAYTLKIRNTDSEESIVDIDLVPVIKFQLPRWPGGYREVRQTLSKEWLVVPKPNKVLQDEIKKNRCWRLSFQEFEREIMKGCQNLKITIRLVKKLRDNLKLNAIASYYIKTLFLLKIDQYQHKVYWENTIYILFLDMVQELHAAIKIKNIPYYWNENHNLINDLKSTVQEEYVKKLEEVINSLKAYHTDRVVAFLLTPEELKQFHLNPIKGSKEDIFEEAKNPSLLQTSEKLKSELCSEKSKENANVCNSENEYSDRRIPKEVPVNSSTEPNSSGYIKDNSTANVTVMGAQTNESCADDIVGMVSEIGKLGQGYLNIKHIKQQLYNCIINCFFDRAVIITKLIQRSSNGTLINETVTRLLKEKVKYTMIYAYKLWHSGARDLVIHYFPEPFKLILNEEDLIIKNKKDGLPLKLAANNNRLYKTYRLACGDGKNSPMIRLSWKLIPVWNQNMLYYKIKNVNTNMYLKLDVPIKFGDMQAWGSDNSNEKSHLWSFEPIKYNDDILFFIINHQYNQRLKLRAIPKSCHNNDRLLCGHHGSVYADPGLFGWFIQLWT